MGSKKNALIEVENKFDRNWLKIRKRILQKVSAEDDEDEIVADLNFTYKSLIFNSYSFILNSNYLILELD